jgi:glycosyltransferase involved in cell wall biosynthesis
MYKVMMMAPVPFFEDRGTPMRILEISRSLQSLGNRVTVYTYPLGRSVPGIQIVRSPRIPWYVDLPPGPTYRKILLDGLLAGTSLCGIASRSYDIAHASLHEGLAISSLMRVFKKIPLVFDAHGSLTDEMVAHNFVTKKGLEYKLWHTLESFLDRQADAIIASSPVNVERIITVMGVDRRKVFLVGEGVDTERFRPKYYVSDLKEKLGIPQSRKVVVYLGLLSRGQGTCCLMRAIPHVLSHYDNVHFLVMGYPNSERYARMARALGILERVTFTGKINYNDAPQYLCLGDIAVAPKISLQSEGNGKVYNYMASGLPTVAFDHPVNRYILGECGIYAKMADEISLAQCLVKLLGDEKFAGTLASQVRERAVKTHTWASVAKRVMEIYQMVAEKA